MFKFLEDLKKKREKKEIARKVDRFKRARDFFVAENIDEGNFDILIKNFRDKSLIMLIIGRRGGGKTALGMKFIEVGKIFKKKLYVIGFDDSRLPRWVKKETNINKIPNNSLVLIDEAGVSYSSRESMKRANKDLAKLLVVARHKNLSLIFITQNSAMIDLNVIRLSDVLLFKEPSLLQARFERKSLQDLFKRVADNFKNINNKINYFYVISDDFEGLVENDLPYFWNETISKSFSRK